MIDSADPATPQRHSPTVKKKAAPKPDEITEPTFEEAMAGLEETVSHMESDSLPLEELISSYEKGATLLAIARKHIDRARNRIESIKLDGANAPSLEPLDPPQNGDTEKNTPDSTPGLF